MSEELRGWHPDPFDVHEFRFFTDDGKPSRLVKDGGRVSHDEPPPSQGSPPRAWQPHLPELHEDRYSNQRQLTRLARDGSTVSYDASRAATSANTAQMDLFARTVPHSTTGLNGVSLDSLFGDNAADDGDQAEDEATRSTPRTAGSWQSPLRHGDSQDTKPQPERPLFMFPSRIEPNGSAEEPDRSTAVPGGSAGGEGTSDQWRRPRSAATAAHNQVHTVSYRGGWIGLFAGESQAKALQRTIPQLNRSGLGVVAAIDDRWSFWKRLGAVLLFIVTLGLVGRVPDVLLITEPIWTKGPQSGAISQAPNSGGT